MTLLSRTLLAAVLAGSLCPSAFAAPAATGIAFDSVTKFSIAGDASAPAPAPGTFSADFAAASNSGTAGGGDVPKMPFGLGKMMAKASAAMGALKNGTAEKHYIGVTKERVDQLAAKTGEITDCTARTITHLDFDKRTYSVESFDHPETTAPTSGGKSAPGPEPTDDGTKVAIVVTTKALGSMTIEGVPTSGYDMDIKMTATKPTGESSTSTMNMLAYYSQIAEPHFGCASRYAPVAAGRMAGPGMQNFTMLMRAMAANRTDSRFTVTNSGPAIPSGKLAMWQDMKMIASGTDRSTGQSGQSGFSVITERGAIKTPLADSDPVFDVPAGFTKI